MHDAIAIRDAEAEAQAVLGSLDTLVVAHLAKMGLSARELRAIWARVSPKIKKAISRDAMTALASGAIPAKGFGLGSDTGSGKTMAVACLMRKYATACHQNFAAQVVEWTRANPGRRLGVNTDRVLWLCWPDTVTALRTHAIDGEAETILERAESARLLVLDDLGRERIKGSYLDDWAASQLDRIVNHRYREELPTIWTTNLTEPALTAIYGAALLSRLTEDAPLVWLDGLPSMRIQ